MIEYIQQQAKKKKILVGESWLPATQAVIDFMTAPLSTTEKQAIEDFLVRMGTMWDNSVDEMFFGGFSEPANRLIGWKTGLTASVRQGSPTPITGGFQYDGVNDVHDFKFVAYKASGQNNIVNSARYFMVLLDTPPVQGSAGFMCGFRKRYAPTVRAGINKNAGNITGFCNPYSNSNLFAAGHTYQKGTYEIIETGGLNYFIFNGSSIASLNLGTNANENAKWYVGAGNDQTVSGSAGIYGVSSCKIGFHMWTGLSLTSVTTVRNAITQLFADVGITI
jgi:hypothetical protein